MDVSKKIYESLIRPYFEKDPRYIGAEIETILFAPNGDNDNKKAVNHVFKRLISEKNFYVEVMGTDGFIVRVSNGIDAISCDYSYQLLEFSMGKDITVHSIALRFNEYSSFLRTEFMKLGFVFTGMGTNHFRLPFLNDDQFTHDPFYSQVREYVLKSSYYKDPAYFYPMMASAQSHIEVKGSDLLSVLNLFNRLDFVRALLFSNSIPNLIVKQNYFRYPDNLICARDVLWDYQALPNTGLVEKDYESIEDLISHIAEQKIFVELYNGAPSIIDPISVKDYIFAGKDLSTYRSFEHVVLNNYHVVEVRSDCTQPLSDAFSPLAFNVGIAANWQPAYSIMDAFYQNSGHPMNNKLLRKMAITEQLSMDDPRVKSLLYEITDIAKQGLINRGYGEECYLECIYDRIERCSNPALDTIEMINRGHTMLDVAEHYSEIKER